MPHLAKDANLLLALVLELAVYGACGYWAFTRPTRTVAKVAAAIAGSAFVIVVWSLFGAPTCTYPSHGVWRAGLEILWFGAGAAALRAAGRRRLAVVFAAAFLLNKLLVLIWHQ